MSNTPQTFAEPVAIAAAPAHHRRRLWELPREAHELLLGLGFGIAELRREAERVLGRLHRVRCELQGSDSDLLYSVVHDLASRNALSERFQDLLQHRHAAAERAARAARDEAGLRALWQFELAAAGDGEGARLLGCFWALLTHPLGPALQARLLFDLRTRCWQRARAAACDREVRRSLQADIDRLQQQVLAQQQQLVLARQAAQLHDGERQAWARQQAAWQGERDRLSALASPPAPVANADPAPATRGDRDTARGRIAGVRPSRRRQRPAARPPAHEPRPAEVAIAAVEAADRPADARVPATHRHVLCVGGMLHAVPRYREQVERLGARFEHHDGGLEDSLPRLDGHLGRADLVVCQAGCINHEAYHRIKRHCALTGTPCIYLARPSLSRFEAAVTRHLAAPAAARDATKTPGSPKDA